MRAYVLTMIFAAAVWAQSPAPSEQSTKPEQSKQAEADQSQADKPQPDKPPDEALRKNLEELKRNLVESKAVNNTQRQPCAIPLKNVLRPGPPPRMPVVVPRENKRFPMKEVAVPAPSCDDVK